MASRDIRPEGSNGSMILDWDQIEASLRQSGEIPAPFQWTNHPRTKQQDLPNCDSLTDIIGDPGSAAWRRLTGRYWSSMSKTETAKLSLELSCLIGRHKPAVKAIMRAFPAHLPIQRKFAEMVVSGEIRISMHKLCFCLSTGNEDSRILRGHILRALRTKVRIMDRAHHRRSVDPEREYWNYKRVNRNYISSWSTD